MLRRCIIVPVLNVPRMPDEEMKDVDLTNTAYLRVKEKDGYGALLVIGPRPGPHSSYPGHRSSPSAGASRENKK